MVESTNSSSREFISRYEIISELGSGGMGTVYKAKDPLLNNIYAVKVVKSNLVSDDSQVRFQQEAKSLKDFSHAGIPKVYNFGVTDDEELYMVMECAEGKSLQSILKQKKVFEVDEAIDVILQICSALEYAHQRGVVHRDIKPANMIVSESSDSKLLVKVIDFGLAKLRDKAREEQDMTKSGIILGTPPYMSPEQVKGMKVDAQTDIYSLGCVFYELLTGMQPFRGNTALATITMHVSDPAPSLADKNNEFEYSDELEAVVAKCLEKDTEDRYSSISELITELEKLISDSSPSQPMRAPTVETVIPDLSDESEFAQAGKKVNNRGFRILVALALILLGGFVIFAMISNLTEDSSTLNDTLGSYRTTPHVMPKKKKTELIDAIGDQGLLKTNDKVHWDTSNEKSKTIKVDSNFNDEDLANSCQLYRNFQVWDLSNSDVTDEGLSKLDYTFVRNLSLRRTNIDGSGLKALSRCKNLRALSLLKCNNFNPENLKFLVDSKVQFLYLSGDKVSGDTLKLVAGIKSLRMVYIGNTKLEGKHVAKLQSLPQLKDFQMRDVLTSDDVYSELAKLPRLKGLSFLYFGDTVEGKWLEKLRKSKHLEVLNFESTTPSREALLKLAQMTQLKRIVFTDSKVDTKAINMLRKKLPECVINKRAKDPLPARN